MRKITKKEMKEWIRIEKIETEKFLELGKIKLQEMTTEQFDRFNESIETLNYIAKLKNFAN